MAHTILERDELFFLGKISWNGCFFRVSCGFIGSIFQKSFLVVLSVIEIH